MKIKIAQFFGHFVNSFKIKRIKYLVPLSICLALTFGVFQNCGTANNGTQSNGSIGSTSSGSHIASTPANPFCSGSGTSSDPYQVCDAASFAQIWAFPSAFIALTANISLSGTTTTISTFSGTLNGANYTISGLQVVGSWIASNTGTLENLQFSNVLVTASGTNSGIIGQNSGTVSNISFLSGTVSGTAGEEVGGIIGTNTSSITVNTLYFNGTVDMSNLAGGSSSVAGGCVGANHGTISDAIAGAAAQTLGNNTSSSEAIVGEIVGINAGLLEGAVTTQGSTVSGGLFTGGIAGANTGVIGGAHSQTNVNTSVTDSESGGITGYNDAGIIEVAENGGSVSGVYDVGGIVGRQDGSTSSITDCANVGNISTASDTSGGIVGALDVSSGSITRVYSDVMIPTGGNCGGRLIGGVSTGDTISGSYYNSSLSGVTNAIGCGSATGITGLTTAQFAIQSSFVGWDFTSTWEMSVNGYPALQ